MKKWKLVKWRGLHSRHMEKSEPRPKNPSAIRPLDMFLLGLVRGGLITPYDWQAKARTSLGASLPAVRRLVDQGLLKKAATGPRGRHEFALTRDGEDALHTPKLRRYIEQVLEQSTSDTETVLRLASLAALIEGTRAATKLLLKAETLHRKRARDAARRAKSTVPFKSRLSGLYSTLLAGFEEEQETAIANQLRFLCRNWKAETEHILELWDDQTNRRR
jgi:DNA-binding PadR family transcriptional regulator